VIKADKLSSEPARTDLTDRECAKLIGSIVGGLLTMAKPEDVRAALEWWAKNFSAAYPEAVKK
jgi:hypothetical protein